MIVRNESGNMLRILNSVKPIIDFVSIVDTGSTDDTVQVIENWIKLNKLPGKVHFEPFKNFGYNRTHSINKARETFPQADYFLLSDADFVWEIDVCGKFNKKLLHEHKYLVRQTHQNLSYFNIRMLSSLVDWECVGVTHEYWTEKKDNCFKGEITTHTLKTIQIDDKEDGLFKALKFQRDKQLLEEDLKREDLEPFLKSRYLFYLAQTYKCLGEYENSIIQYKNRIECQNWAEEIYYSMYQISYNYKALHDIQKHVIHLLNKSEKSEADLAYLEKHGSDLEEATRNKKEYFELMVKWAFDSWLYRPTRAEALYGAVSFLREHGEHRRAYDLAVIGRRIRPTDDTLFVELSPYDWGFDYEISIVAYYLGDQEKALAQECIEKLLENENLPSWVRSMVINNSKFYT